MGCPMKQVYDPAVDIIDRLRCPEAVLTAYLSFREGCLGPIFDVKRSCATVKESLKVGRD